MSRVDAALRLAGLRGKQQPENGAPSGGIGAYPTEGGARAQTATPLERRQAPADVSEAVPEPAPVPDVARLYAHLATAAAGRTVIDPSTNPVAIEQYRRLAAQLHLQQGKSGLRTIMVTSAMPRDGKTLTTANLALTLSEVYQRRVLLIDADLRQPSQHLLFKIGNRSGLIDCLRGGKSPAQTWVHLTPTLWVIPAGPDSPNGLGLLASSRMRDLIKAMADRVDWVIVDTPPVGLLSDAQLVADAVEGVILVVNAETTPYKAAQRAIAELGPDRILGAVLNCAETHQTHYYRHYQNYWQDDGSKGPVT